MKINIFNHLPAKTFVIVDDPCRLVLFTSNNSLTNLAKRLHISIKNMSRYKTGTRATPKEVFLKLLKLSSKDLSYFQNKIFIKVGRKGNILKIGPYIDITEEWIYISELMRGDGSLVRGNNDSYRLVFTNTDLNLINHVRKSFLNLGINEKSINIYPNVQHPHVKHLVVNSEIVSYLLNSFFQIPFRKKNKMILPAFISKERNFAISAIRGIFDAEGSVYIKSANGIFSRRATIVGFDNGYLNSIQILLNKLNIHSTIFEEKREHLKYFYRLIIRDRDSLIRFKEIIKPLHKKRAEKLALLTTSYKSDWISSKTLNIKILNLLSECNLRRKELSNSLNISIPKLGSFLIGLRNKELIYVVKNVVTNKGSWFIYGITKKGKDYLKIYSEDFS